MEPLNKETFSAELEAIRNPTDDVVRKPLQWLVPNAESKAETPEEECADRAFKTMMSYIKLLQKHYSDLIMTTKIKEFTDEEKELWDKDRYDIMFKIVECYSMIEFVKNFPEMCKQAEDGTMQFNLSAFHPNLKKGKNGQLYIDEYEMNEGKRKQDMEHAEALRLMQQHEDYDEELGRILTDEELKAREEGGEADLPDVLIE